MWRVVLIELIVPKGIRSRRALALAAAAALLAVLAGCAKVPLVGGKPAAKLTLTATADCNSCDKGAGYPLTLRLLQVTDASALTGTTLVQLWDREDKLLGGAFVSKSEDVVDPGTRKEWKVELDSKTKAVVVVGNFCKAGGSCWYLVKPVKGGGVSLKLALEASCLREAKR